VLRASLGLPFAAVVLFLNWCLTGSVNGQQPDAAPVQKLAPALAPSNPEPSQSTIQTNVHLVLVPVTVTDRKGGLVEGLNLEDFLLTDDGVRQEIRMDTSDTVLAPVALVIAVEANGISSPELAKIHRVGGMFQPLIAGERGQAAVIAYDSEVRTFEDFTSDSSKIGAAIEAIDARAIKTAKLIDAVAEGVRMLATKPEHYRRELVIIGESRDRGSQMKLGQAIELAQHAGVTIYFATYSVQASAWTAKPEDNPTMPGGDGLLGAITELSRLGTTNAAEALANATGGRHLPFLTLSSLEKTLTRTGEEIHSQYLLSFVPAASKNAGFHRVEVKVPTRPEAVVRARPGYWSEK
jgi:VWFA-related protein